MGWKDFFRDEPQDEPDKEEQEKELPPDMIPIEGVGMVPAAMMGMFDLDQQMEPNKPQFVIPPWLKGMIDRVIDRFPEEDLPKGWNIQAWQDEQLYYIALQGPVVGRGRMGNTISASHELEFEKTSIRNASEDVAEWTLYKALEEVFALIGKHGPFPPELESMM